MNRFTFDIANESVYDRGVGKIAPPIRTEQGVRLQQDQLGHDVCTGHVRRLFVIDIENIAGSAYNVTPAGALRVRRLLERELGLADDEQAVIAVTADQGVFPVAQAFPGKQVLVRRGASGADLALIESIDARHTAARYDEVVLVSGDGIFAQLASMLAYYGATVTVAADANQLSARLRLASHRTHILNTLTSMYQKAAA